MTAISIIVPVYNAAATIGRMLDSIKEQSMSDFEVLMINDGSTDASGNILDGYHKLKQHPACTAENLDIPFIVRRKSCKHFVTKILLSPYP